jgi:hypothetical protein
VNFRQPVIRVTAPHLLPTPVRPRHAEKAADNHDLATGKVPLIEGIIFDRWLTKSRTIACN